MKIILPVILLTATFALQSCIVNVHGEGWEEEATNWRHTQKRNRRHIEQLTLGQSRADIVNVMGKADIVESFKRAGSVYTVAYYRTDHRHSDGDTTKDETTPLVFIDDQLVGWGASAIAHATE